MTQQSNLFRSFDGAPTFNHPDHIRHLYENGLQIDRNILREILALPRETLIDDLSGVLDDAKSRYESLVKAAADSLETNFHEDDLSFPLHALFLLQEIDCSRSFDLALGFLKSEDSDCAKNQDFIGFWFGDHICETIWQIFFHVEHGREQELADFLFVRHVDSFTKSPASTALQQLAFHCPERTQAIHKLFESVFQRFLTTEYDEEVFDCHLVSAVIMDYVTTCPSPVSPLVQKLFENGLVDEMYCGNYSSLMASYRNVHDNDILKIYDIFELYDDVVNTWPGYNPKKKSVLPESLMAEILKAEPVMAEPVRDENPEWSVPEPYKAIPKIGRNDPCPCGSGKKYKKCCLE